MFSYFWVAMMFQPSQIAEDLKRNGGYIPGVRPGKPTADFLDFTMTRLTFAGAFFLTIIFLLPVLTGKFSMDPITHNPINKPCVIEAIKGGKITFVKTITKVD